MRCFLIVCLSWTCLMAGSFEVSIKLETRDLESALKETASAFDMDLVYADALLKGLVVDCRLEKVSAEQAFDILLKNTGLGWKRLQSNRIVLFALKAEIFEKVSGVVLGGPGQQPLQGARISIDNSARVVITDAEGRFLLDRLQTIPKKLTIRAENYITRKLATRGNRSFEIKLNLEPRLLQHLRVSHPQTKPMQPTNQQLELSPAGMDQTQGELSRDLFDLLSYAPGVDAGSGGQAGVSFRGSAPAENLVLLDGIKLYQMDHAMGYFGAVNADALETVNVYKGASPARYGGRMGGVMDMTTQNPGSGPITRIGVDLDVASLTLSHSLGERLWLMVSSRHSSGQNTTGQIFEQAFERTFNQPRIDPDDDEFSQNRSIRFTDHLIKIGYTASPSDQIDLTLYHGRDYTNDRVFEEFTEYNLDLSDRKGVWGNDGAGLRWRHRWSDAFSSDFNVVWSRYASDFTERESEEISDEEFETIFDEDPDLIPSTIIRRENGLEDVTFRLNQVWEYTRHRFEFGLFHSRFKADYIREGGDEPGREQAETRQTGIFAQDQWRLTERFSVDLGLRAYRDLATEDDFLDPRILFTYDLSPGLQLFGGWGRDHQHVLRTADSMSYFEGSEAWFLAEETMAPGRSEQSQIGVHINRDLFSLSVELYDKKQQGVLVALEDPIGRISDGLQTEDRIQGGEMMFRITRPDWSWMTAYAYSDAHVVQDLEGVPLDYPTDRHSPHQIKTAGSFSTGPWLISAHWRYASGRPYSIPRVVFEGDFKMEDEEDEEPINNDTEVDFRPSLNPNAQSLKPQHRLDLAIRYKFQWRRMNAELGLTFKNLYDRTNVLYRYFRYEDGQLNGVDVTDFGFRTGIYFRLQF